MAAVTAPDRLVAVRRPPLSSRQTGLSERILTGAFRPGEHLLIAEHEPLTDAVRAGGCTPPACGKQNVLAARDSGT